MLPLILLAAPAISSLITSAGVSAAVGTGIYVANTKMKKQDQEHYLKYLEKQKKEHKKKETIKAETEINEQYEKSRQNTENEKKSRIETAIQEALINNTITSEEAEQLRKECNK